MSACGNPRRSDEHAPLLAKTSSGCLGGHHSAAPPSASRSPAGRLCLWCSRKRKVVALSLFVGTCVLFAALQIAHRPPKSDSGALALDVLSQEYDAIIIGGGPAGAVTAKLLSDDKWRRVLLIEAGDASQAELGGKNAIPSPHNVQGLTMFDVPFFWTKVANTASLHWDYPDVNIAKALGGCGIHNAMLYVRALPSDMERWDMEGWTWEKTLELYLAVEEYYGANSSVHSKSGFVRVSPATTIDNTSRAFIEACEEVGIPTTDDFNAPGGRYGAGFYNFNTRDGIRESVARTFLGPILRGNDSTSTRDNFHLMLNTTVDRITISDGLTADGVQIRLPNGTRQLIQLAENGTVVLTAGAINTPKILMQSGIGDVDVLNQLGIPVKKHLPRVGMNLQDHPVLGVTFEATTPHVYSVKEELDIYFNATKTRQTDPSSYGLMGSAGLSAGAFLIPPGSTTPEIQLTLFPRKSEPHMTNSSSLQHSAEVLITVALVNPRARNRVNLVKREHDGELIPYIEAEVPVNETEHLQHADVWKLAWGVSVVREIGAALAEKGIFGLELSPGASISKKQDLEKWVLDSVFRNTHWVGSASMGYAEDNGVVDSHLRVFGVDQLRIADASVIPFIPNGNVHSTVVMAAFHGAELLKRDELANDR